MVRHGFVLGHAHPRRGVARFTVLVAILVAAAFPARAAAVGPAFDPTTPTAFVAQGVPTQLEKAVESNGQLVFQNVGPPASSVQAYNALAYDTNNNYLYAVTGIGDPTHPGEILQIGSDGIPSFTGVVVNNGPTSGWGTGAFDPATGELWFGGNGSSTYFLYNPATGATRTVTQSGGDPLHHGNDMTYANGFFWGQLDDPSGPIGIFRLDPATGQSTDFLNATLFPGGDGAGANWTYGNGNLGFSDNATGLIYQISIANPASASPTFTLVSRQPGPPNANNDGASIPGLPTDLAMNKSAPTQVTNGGQLTYTLTITNNGPGNSSGYTISDTLPADLSNPTTTSTGCSISGRVLTCVSANPLPAGQTSAPVTVTGSVPNPFVAAITNCATVGGNEQDPNAANNTGCVTTNPQADVSIVKSASPTPAVPGTNETYSLVVKNNGPNTAFNVKATDKLPSGLSFVSASSGCTEASGTVTCSLASLAPGASQTFTVTGHIASSVDSCSDLRNTATVTNDVIDSDLANNSASVCPPPFGQVDLAIVKDASRAQVPSGGQVIYTLVVTNKGPSDDTGVKVTDPLPAGLKLVSVKPSQGSCSTSGSDITCSLGTLKAGGSAQILLTAQVTVTGSANACGDGSGTITNPATVTGDKAEINTSDNRDDATICPTPGPDPKFDLVVDKTANHTTITAGKSVTYTIVVTNKGPDAAPNVDLTDTLSAPVTVVSVKTTQGSCTKSIPMSCSLGTIPAGGKVTITVVARPKTAGCKQRNTASATGAGTDTNPANNLDTVDLCVKVDLRMTKVADHTTVDAGGVIHYTIRVTNPSKYNLTNVRVCDTLPSGLSYVSSKPKATLSKGRQCWTIKSLKAHRSKTFRLTVRALRGASGSETNRVTATGDGVRTRRAHRTVRVLGRAVGPAPVTG